VTTAHAPLRVGPMQGTVKLLSDTHLDTEPAAIRGRTAPDRSLISENRGRVAADVAFPQRSAHATVAWLS